MRFLVSASDVFDVQTLALQYLSLMQFGNDFYRAFISCLSETFSPHSPRISFRGHVISTIIHSLVMWLHETGLINIYIHFGIVYKQYLTRLFLSIPRQRQARYIYEYPLDF